MALILTGQQIEALRRTNAVTQFGVDLFGNYEAADVGDLIKTYDYQEKQLADAIAAETKRGGWLAADAAGWSQFVTDWAAWKYNYDAIRNRGMGSNADAYYKELAAAFKPLADFDRRLRIGAGNKAAPTYSATPQPKAQDKQLQLRNSLPDLSSPSKWPAWMWLGIAGVLGIGYLAVKPNIVVVRR